MIWRPTYQRRIAQLADGVATAISFFLAYYGWSIFNSLTDIGKRRRFDVSWESLWFVIVFSIIFVIVLARLNAYSRQIFTSLENELKLIIKASIVGVFVFFAAYFILRIQYVPRAFILIFIILNPLCLLLEKLTFFYIDKSLQRKRKGRERILIVGTGKRAADFVEAAQEKWGMEIMGFLSKDEKEREKKLLGKKIIGAYSDIDDILRENIIDEVIICVSEYELADTKKILDICETEGIQVRINSDFFGHLVKSMSVDYFYNRPIVSIHTILHDEWALYTKRFIDVAVSGILLLLSLPLFLVIALLIKLTSKGPIFFEWKLLGRNKKPFTSYKFRTMVENAEEIEKELREKDINEMNGVYFKLKNDFRVTKIGRFLRKFSLDELPQLYSVLKGDMSLVGPRPVRILEKDELHSWHRRRFSIRPGVTSLWVIKGKNIISDFDEIAKLDLQYIDNWSLWLDFKILFKTLPILILGKNI
jgi:exopolysaccharide biosynthesis polyprenyl glycosylphosphotransferase